MLDIQPTIQSPAMAFAAMRTIDGTDRDPWYNRLKPFLISNVLY